MARKSVAPPRLGGRKVAELVGLVALFAALLLAAAFVSHRPDDPSILHRSTAGGEVRNWVGPFGAELSALGFGFLGLAALLAPLLLLVAAWRRLKRRPPPRVLGRGIGGVLLLVALPGLLQALLADVTWRGAEIPAGGGIGVVLVGSLTGVVGTAGALFVLVGAVTIAAALVVQSSLGEIVGRSSDRVRALASRASMALARWRQRREKDRARRRVVAKHLKRSVEERAPAAAATAADLPLRVVEKSGEGHFSVRRVEAGAPAPAPAEEAAARPQRRLAFPKVATGPRSLPPLDLLNGEETRATIEETELVRLGEIVRGRCAEFGVAGTIEAITPGPVITTYEFQPAPGVKVSQIVNLQDDLALALKADSVRIDRLPGRSTLGIEVPNRERGLIRLGFLLGRKEFQRATPPLTVALGTTIHGEPYFADLATMPHLLVAGATGSGKSVGLQSMITSILYKARREEVQFILIDPKRIELGVYKDIPHLKTEVVVEPKKAANALRWAVGEMERRYRLLAELHVRSIAFYNQAIRDPEVRKRLELSDDEGELGADDLKPLPYYVIVIDELADLMMVSSADVEAAIARLAQMARAVGIHLVVATQRPSVDVLTGTIKANFPCRISYATATRHDSRTILDQIGAEKLLGRGDMLFMPPGTSRVFRLHGAYVSEQETAALIRWLKKQGRPELDLDILETPEESREGAAAAGDVDELFDEAARLVVAEQQASASFLQRRMRIGFSRAARLIDIMEREGLLGPPQGSKPREVLVKADYFEEIDRARVGVEA